MESLLYSILDPPIFKVIWTGTNNFIISEYYRFWLQFHTISAHVPQHQFHTIFAHLPQVLWYMCSVILQQELQTFYLSYQKEITKANCHWPSRDSHSKQVPEGERLVQLIPHL